MYLHDSLQLLLLPRLSPPIGSSRQLRVPSCVAVAIRQLVVAADLQPLPMRDISWVDPLDRSQLMPIQQILAHSWRGYRASSSAAGMGRSCCCQNSWASCWSRGGLVGASNWYSPSRWVHRQLGTSGLCHGCSTDAARGFPRCSCIAASWSPACSATAASWSPRCSACAAGWPRGWYLKSVELDGWRLTGPLVERMQLLGRPLCCRPAWHWKGDRGDLQGTQKL